MKRPLPSNDSDRGAIARVRQRVRFLDQDSTTCRRPPIRPPKTKSRSASRRRAPPQPPANPRAPSFAPSLADSGSGSEVMSPPPRPGRRRRSPASGSHRTSRADFLHDALRTVCESSAARHGARTPVNRPLRTEPARASDDAPGVPRRFLRRLLADDRRKVIEPAAHRRQIVLAIDGYSPSP
jgi:hypothetical protein